MIAGGHRSAGGFRPRPQANVAQPLGREADPAEHGRWLAVRGSPSMTSESSSGQAVRPQEGAGGRESSRSSRGWARRRSSSVRWESLDRFARASTAARPGLAVRRGRVPTTGRWAGRTSRGKDRTGRRAGCKVVPKRRYAGGTPSQLAIGMMYLLGRGVERDESRALRWFISVRAFATQPFLARASSSSPVSHSMI